MKQTSREASRVQANPMDGIRSLIAANEDLEVRIPEDAAPVTYYSKARDASGERLLIAWPADRGTRMAIRKGQLLDFCFVRKGIPNNFSGLVDETLMEPSPEVWILLNGPLRQVQRRQNFRVKCLLPIEIYDTTPEDPANESSPAPVIQTVSTDLSAGGISFRHARRIPEGTRVNMKLSLPDNGPVINVPCAVIYSEHVLAHQTLYRTGLRYLALSEGERSRIVRFVYRTQLQGLHS